MSKKQINPSFTPAGTPDAANSMNSTFTYSPHFEAHTPAARNTLAGISTKDLPGLDSLPIQGMLCVTQNIETLGPRLEWSPFDASGNIVAWDQTKHPHYGKLVMASRGLNVVMDYLSGTIHGKAGLIVTVPLAKLANPTATGDAGFVKGDYQNDWSYTDAGGNRHFVEVESQYLPQRAENWRALDMAAGRLITNDWELDLMPGISDTDGGFWRATIAEQILLGSPISIGIGDRLSLEIQKIEAILKGAQSQEMIANADSFRRKEGREAGRVTRQLNQNLQVAQTLQALGESQPVTHAGLLVVDDQGGTVDLAVIPWKSRVTVIDAAGITMLLPMGADNPMGRSVLAETLRKGNLRVVASQF